MHTRSRCRETFWRANNEGIEGEEAENWLYTHFLEIENVLRCALRYGTLTPSPEPELSAGFVFGSLCESQSFRESDPVSVEIFCLVKNDLIARLPSWPDM